MKILKPGKVEMRKFVCPNCGCEFVADRGDVDQNCVKCPHRGCHDFCKWNRGEPYKEPTQGKDSVRLNELICAMPEFMTSSQAAEFLINHGATFREE